MHKTGIGHVFPLNPFSENRGLSPIFLAEYLRQNDFVAGSDAYKALMQLGATLVGTAVGALASGDVKGASTGANAAFVGVTNNHLKHAEVATMIDKLKACKARSCSDKEQEDILGYYRKLSASRSPYDLLNSEVADDVLAGERLMIAYTQESGSFRANSTISALINIDKEQASIARNAPTVQPALTSADNLKRIKAENYQGQQSQNLIDALRISSPILAPYSLLGIGATTVPLLTELTGLSAEAIAINSAFGAGSGYLSAKAQGKSDNVTAAMTAWGAVQPLLGAGYAKWKGGTWSAELAGGGATGLFGNYLTQQIEMSELGKPFSYRDFAIAGGLGVVNSAYTGWITKGMPTTQAQSLGTQFGVNVSNPVPWIDLSQTKYFEARDAAKSQSAQGGK